MALAGCASGSDPPRALVDGSPARAAVVRFESVDGPVLRTVVRRLDLASARVSTNAGSCLRAGWSSRPGSPVVRRVGTSGESVTFPGRSGRTVQACDGIGARAGSTRWCGHAFGRLVGGALLDPRLDVGGCATADGDAVAFAWIDPGPGTRYVVIGRDGYSEAYGTDRALPVRVAVTERIELPRSRATIVGSEHDARGRLLRRWEVDAAVSG